MKLQKELAKLLLDLTEIKITVAKQSDYSLNNSETEIINKGELKLLFLNLLDELDIAHTLFLVELGKTNYIIERIDNNTYRYTEISNGAKPLSHNPIYSMEISRMAPLSTWAQSDELTYKRVKRLLRDIRINREVHNLASLVHPAAEFSEVFQNGTSSRGSSVLSLFFDSDAFPNHLGSVEANWINKTATKKVAKPKLRAEGERSAIFPVIGNMAIYYSAVYNRWLVSNDLLTV